MRYTQQYGSNTGLVISHSITHKAALYQQRLFYTCCTAKLSSCHYPELMISAFQEHMSRYMKVVGLTILAYDYLVTMDAEVRLMWGSKWGMARVLFCISRYLPFVASAIYHYYLFAVESTLTDYEQCFPLYDAAMWLNAISICAANGLLILKTYAMWKCNRKILYGLLAFFSILLTVAFVLEVKAGHLLSCVLHHSHEHPNAHLKW